MAELVTRLNGYSTGGIDRLLLPLVEKNITCGTIIGSVISSLGRVTSGTWTDLFETSTKFIIVHNLLRNEARSIEMFKSQHYSFIIFRL